MSVNHEQPIRRWAVVAFFGVIAVATMSCVNQAEPRVQAVDDDSTAPRPKPLKLKAIYEVKERIPQGDGGSDLIKCDLVFQFTNSLPIPIRLAFPPEGVFFGGEVSFAKAPGEGVPDFAREKRVVEFGPNETRNFASPGHAIVGVPGKFEWVFGRPSEGALPDNLFIGSVYSVPVEKLDSTK